MVNSGLEQPLKLQQQLREQERINLTAPAETEQPTLQATEEQSRFWPWFKYRFSPHNHMHPHLYRDLYA